MGLLVFIVVTEDIKRKGKTERRYRVKKYSIRRVVMKKTDSSVLRIRNKWRKR